MDRIEFRLKLKSFKITQTEFGNIVGVRNVAVSNWNATPKFAVVILEQMGKMTTGERAEFIEKWSRR